MKYLFTFLLALCATFAFGQPTTDAPTPTKAAADVISIYSDAYTNVATNYSPSWGQSGTVNTTYDPTGGGTNYVLAYTNFNFQGTDITKQNAAAMEYLHIDLWTAADPAKTTIKISPINNGTGTGETLVSIAYTSGKWISVDIPKSSFTGMTWDSVHQLKVAANETGSTVPVDVYLDNIYFWKKPLSTNTDATLSDLQVDNKTVTGFSGATTTYTYELPNGTTTVPQITSAKATQAAGGATTKITQATAIPGNATVVVTAIDGTTKKTYKVSYTDNLPSKAAPTPPARAAADVFSLYSDAYTTGPTFDTFDAGWCKSPSYTAVTIAGNNALRKKEGCHGIDFKSDKKDLSAFTHLHFDFYTTDTDLTGDVFNVKLVDFGGSDKEASSLQVNINGGTTPKLEANKWVSVDINITTLTEPVAGSLNRKDIAQFVITTTNSDNVWYDNIYLHKNTTLSIGETDNRISIYPNPFANHVEIQAAHEVSQVRVYNITGQEILRDTPNKARFTLDTAHLSKGVYLLSLESNGKNTTAKMVK